jgi:GNAT superfamily N-acetyltransferase
MDRHIVQLTAAHRAGAAKALAAAFLQDPSMVHMLPDPVSRPARLERLIGWMVDDTLRRGGVILGTPGLEVVSLWKPPGTMHRHEPIWHPGAIRFLGIFGRYLGRALQVDEGIRSHLPRDSNWLYLRMLGVRPDLQGKGLGGLAVRAGLAELSAGAPAVLETATPANVGLYQRLGYEPLCEWDVKGGGPHFWTMTRGVEDAG